MKLLPAESTINYQYSHLVSENGKWEMGGYQMLFGIRVSCGQIGHQFYLKGGYCCGKNAILLAEVLVNLRTILEQFPESATNGEVERMLPQWETRPIHNDKSRELLAQMAADIKGVAISNE